MTKRGGRWKGEDGPQPCKKDGGGLRVGEKQHKEAHKCAVTFNLRGQFVWREESILGGYEEKKRTQLICRDYLAVAGGKKGNLPLEKNVGLGSSSTNHLLGKKKRGTGGLQ